MSVCLYNSLIDCNIVCGRGNDAPHLMINYSLYVTRHCGGHAKTKQFPLTIAPDVIAILTLLHVQKCV